MCAFGEGGEKSRFYLHTATRCHVKDKLLIASLSSRRTNLARRTGNRTAAGDVQANGGTIAAG